jgi:hypothetical protein
VKRNSGNVFKLGKTIAKRRVSQQSFKFNSGKISALSSKKAFKKTQTKLHLIKKKNSEHQTSNPDMHDIEASNSARLKMILTSRKMVSWRPIGSRWIIASILILLPLIIFTIIRSITALDPSTSIILHMTSASQTRASIWTIQALAQEARSRFALNDTRFQEVSQLLDIESESLYKNLTLWNTLQTDTLPASFDQYIQLFAAAKSSDICSSISGVVCASGSSVLANGLTTSIYRIADIARLTRDIGYEQAAVEISKLTDNLDILSAPVSSTIEQLQQRIISNSKAMAAIESTREWLLISASMLAVTLVFCGALIRVADHMDIQIGEILRLALIVPTEALINDCQLSKLLLRISL